MRGADNVRRAVRRIRETIRIDQQFIVKASLPRNEWLYEMLLSFGEKVEIVHPISLIKEIIERCEKALSHHKGAES